MLCFFARGRAARCAPAVAALLALTALLCACGVRTGAPCAYPEDGAAMCRSFLESAGWRPAPTPAETGYVTIPETFGAVYGSYNALQRAQGFDLLPYRGKTVAKYVFELTDPPGGQPPGGVRATVFVYGGRVIGGDVSCVAADGSMRGILP